MNSIKQNRFLRQVPKKENEEVDLRKNGSNISLRSQGKREGDTRSKKTQDRKQFSKWIEGPTLKGIRES